MLYRLIVNWMYGGFLAGLLLVLLAPLLTHGWPSGLVACFFCLPAYMIHQYEEHDSDRFRRTLNRALGGGREVLTPLAVFMVNVPGIWGAIAVSLWLGMIVNRGFALIAIYLLLLNAAVHIVHGAVTRAYNPGLASAVLLFLPIGCWGLIALQMAGEASVAMHVTGIACAAAIHLAVVVVVLRNWQKYDAMSAKANA